MLCFTFLSFLIHARLSFSSPLLSLSFFFAPILCIQDSYMTLKLPCFRICRGLLDPLVCCNWCFRCIGDLRLPVRWCLWLYLWPWCKGAFIMLLYPLPPPQSNHPLFFLTFRIMLENPPSASRSRSGSNFVLNLFFHPISYMLIIMIR